MPTFSPAQVILTLWLLAAVAPAATVFVHGTLRAIAPARAVAQARGSVAKVAVDAAKVGAKKRVAHSAVKWTDSAKTEVAADFVSVVARADSLCENVTDASLLHTALQRHRPRAA